MPYVTNNEKNLKSWPVVRVIERVVCFCS